MRIAAFLVPLLFGIAGCASSSPDAPLSSAAALPSSAAAAPSRAAAAPSSAIATQSNPTAAPSSAVAAPSDPTAAPSSAVAAPSYPTAAPSSAAAAPSLTPQTSAAPEAKASAKAPSTEVAKTFADASNLFAVDLYASLRKQPGNLAVSPASIALALMMTWGGARTETADEMAKVLHLAGPVSSARDAWLTDAGRQISTWNDPSRTIYTLSIANRLFGEKTYEFEPAYLKKTRDIFGAPLQPVDFLKASEPSRQLINAWVANQTRNRIKDVLPPGLIDKETRLVLVNAIYFLGKWEKGFKKESTLPTPFFTTAATSTNVPMMHQLSEFIYAEDDGMQMLDLRYKGGEIGMSFFLPKTKDGLDALEQKLTHKNLMRWLRQGGSEKVDVWLPRFKIEPSVPISLKDELSAMGMKRAFNPDEADFTGMAKPRSEPLCIADVVHKAFVLVDEEGTEAAAATAVVMKQTRSVDTGPRSFRADHPFLFVVRDLKSQTILFMGRVVNPAGG